MTLHQKSDSVNRWVSTRRTFLSNFIPTRFETTESFVERSAQQQEEEQQHN